MKSLRLNSIQQAAKVKMLDRIAIAAQVAAFKANGGTVEVLGVTRSHTFGVKTQHTIMV